MEKNFGMDGTAFVGWREGDINQVNCSSSSNLFHVMLSVAKGLKSTLKLSNQKFLVGKQRW
jgi:hypothetical protein